MNKLCPYFQIPGHGEDVLDAWPGLESALFMDIGPDFAARLRSKYPGLEICLRIYEEEGHGWLHISPDEWASRFAAVGPDYAISWTMPLSHDDADLFGQFDDWSVRFARAARQYGIEPVGLCVGTGNFTAAADRVKVSDAFPGICQEYNVLGPQDYGWPDLQSQVYWHALRWTAWHDDIEEAFGKDMLFMPMECGLTQAVLEGRPDEGWQSGADGVTDESYISTMRWYNGRLCLLPYVKRAYVYLFHGYGDWATFDHFKKPRIWHALRDFDAPGEQPPEPPPEQPPAEEPPMTDEIKVFDMNGQEQDLAWAKDKYGVAFRRAEAAPGQKVYRLVELREKSGPASLVTQVVDEQGNPIDQMDVAFYWPGAPDPPDPPTDVLPHDWHRNFVHGLTNANGDVGPGMGGGAAHAPGEGGPHAVWVRDPDIVSDICEKLGWLAGTPHDHLDQKFKLMRADEENGDGEEPAGELVEIARLEEPHDAAMLCVAYPESVAFDTDVRAGITGSDLDLDTTPLEAFSHGGRDYALGCVCCDWEGEGLREYWIRAFSLVTKEDATPAAKEIFAAKPDLRKVIVVFDFAEEPPEKPPGDVAAIYKMIAAAHRSLKHGNKILAECYDKLAELADG